MFPRPQEMKITYQRIVFLAIVFTFICTAHSNAQSTFVRLYNKGNMGYTVREVNGNSYVVAGGTDYYYNWHWFIQSSLATTNIHLFKTDVNGVLQWERVIGKLNTRMIARWMEPTVDGGFILTGAANRDVVWPPDSNDVFLAKTDASGMISWCKVFDTGKDDLGFCVQQTADSGFIISGFYDAVPLSLAVNTYIQLIKTDASGNVQWEKKYQFAVRDFNTHEPFSYVVKQTSNGGYVVVGTNAIAHPADVEVMRTDASGNVMWAKTYEHDNSIFRNSVGLDVIETSSGDFVIAGSMDKDSPLHINYPYFLKISSAGAVIKQRFYETLPVLNFQSGFSSVQQTTDGGYFFTGMGGYSDFGDQAQLLKTNANLDMTWSRVYTMDGMATVGSMSGRQTSDGGYVFTGKRQMSGAMLMKTNGIGLVACKIPNTLIEYTPSVTVSSWTPAVVNGLSTSNVLLNVSSPMVDTSIVCPVTVPTLPVELNYFSALSLPGKKVQVDWMTASEFNSSFFIVERSGDNKEFEEAGMTAAAGNSSVPRSYVLVDEHPYVSGTSYYRLREVDYDGTNHYSKSVPVSFSSHLEILNTYADHANHTLNIQISHENESLIDFELSDITGKIISRDTRRLSTGISTMTVDMESFSNGIYFLSLLDEGNKKVLKLVY